LLEIHLSVVFSFAKYLELTFYYDELYSRALVCKHNIHRDYTRFITYKDRMFEFHLDKIDVMDVAVPPLQLRIDAQAQLANKTDEYISVQKAAGAFWDSVVARIHNFKDDVLPFEKKEAGVQAMHEFSKRVIEDRKAFSRVLDKAYEDTPLSRPSGINAARHSLQDFVIAWEQEFTL
jgi:1-phosphatidylinositol-3-phosphate 5-kinase